VSWSHWNYRVVARTREFNGEPWEEWSFIEAYYDEAGTIIAWCDADAPASDCSPEDLVGSARLMADATRLPVVDAVDLPGDDAPWASTHNHGYDTPMHAALAGLVRSQLRQQGRTQTWLAEECGVSQKHISTTLTGLAEASFSMWESMAKALGIEWRVRIAIPRRDGATA
jgi:DNA-binding phage protein